MRDLQGRVGNCDDLQLRRYLHMRALALVGVPSPWKLDPVTALSSTVGWMQALADACLQPHNASLAICRMQQVATCVTQPQAPHGRRSTRLQADMRYLVHRHLRSTWQTVCLRLRGVPQRTLSMRCRRWQTCAATAAGTRSGRRSTRPSGAPAQRASQASSSAASGRVAGHAQARHQPADLLRLSALMLPCLGIPSQLTGLAPDNMVGTCAYNGMCLRVYVHSQSVWHHATGKRPPRACRRPPGQQSARSSRPRLRPAAARQQPPLWSCLDSTGPTSSGMKVGSSTEQDARLMHVSSAEPPATHVVACRCIFLNINRMWWPTGT